MAQDKNDFYTRFGIACARADARKAAAEAETVSWDLVERESKPRVPHDG